MSTANTQSPLMIRRQNDVCVVEFLDTNILEGSKIDRIRSELDALADKMGYPKIVLSFDGVTHLASAMLGVLMSVNKKIGTMKGQLRLAHLSPMIMEVVRITKLDKVLKIYESSAKALEKF